MPAKTIVYILCAGHSGSTLLDLMIGSNADCTSLGEFMHIQHSLKNGQLICQICREECDQWKRFKEIVKPPYYHEAAFEAFQSRILVDSSKNVRWAIRRENPSDADIRYIRLRRNGLAVFNKVKRKEGKVSSRAVMGWVDSNLEFDAFLNDVPENSLLDIFYEELCNDAEMVLRRICKFLGLSYSSKMTEFWSGDHHILSGNGKPISLTALHKGKIRRNDMHSDGQDFFDRYGYAVTADDRYKEGLSDQDKGTFIKYGQWLNYAYGYTELGRGQRFPAVWIAKLRKQIRRFARVVRTSRYS